jgi:hypothetical protein
MENMFIVFKPLDLSENRIGYDKRTEPILSMSFSTSSTLADVSERRCRISVIFWALNASPWDMESEVKIPKRSSCKPSF